MKKLALVAMLASVSTLAMANNGYYVQGDVGYARVKADGVNGGDNTVSYGVSAGKEMGNGARLAVDYTQLANDEFSDDDSGQFKLKVRFVGVSAIYDFKNTTEITPYLGVRVAANRLSVEGEGVDSMHSTKGGLGAVAGVQYQITPNFAIDGAVEYNKLGKFEGVRLSQNGIKAGLRYNF